jgi:hypothetical protein
MVKASILFLVVIALPVFAGSGVVAVVGEDGKLCVADEPEYRVVRTTIDKMIGAATEWMDELPPKEPDLTMAFSGYIKFCAADARKKYFRAVIERLGSPQKNERAYLLILLHSKSNELRQMIDEEIAKKPTSPLKENLEKAKRLLIYQLETPEPFPTEKTIRKIERKLRG